MKSKPMLFSAPMVRALLEGRKTQTRRIMKLQPNPTWTFWIEYPFGRAMATYRAFPKSGPARWAIASAPFSNGDEIWVRESYYQRGHWEQISGLKARSRTGRQRWKFVPADDVVVFDAPDVFRKGRHAKDPAAIAWHKRLGRFMPRWASRITLKVIDVRVQRLQDISEEDAKAEGLKCLSKDGGQVWKWGIPDADGEPGNDNHGWHWHRWSTSPVEAYRSLWESINGPGSWDANPFVWAYTFEVKR